MERRRKGFLATLSAVAILLLGVGVYSIADEYDEHGRHERREGGKRPDRDAHGGRSHAQTAVYATYADACGRCHWAYVPVLLPAKSWANIMAALGSHFGNGVTLTPQQWNDVSGYLASNSSDNAGAKIGRKITKSLGGASPERITDVPYIQHKHRKIDQAALAKGSVGSLSNCIACHPGASNAVFDDDDVKIPAR